MCFFAIAVAAQVAGAAVSAYGAYSQGQAQKKMNQYNADVASQQAKITQRTAETNVNLVQGQAAEATKQERRNVAMIEGEQKGTLAAQGVGGGSVTAADITTSTLDTAELDRQAIRYNADTKAWAVKSGADFEAWNLENQSNQYSMAAKNAARAGEIAATSSLLGSASQVSNTSLMNKYYQR